MKINLLCNDADIVVCEKPAGVLSEHEMPELLCAECGVGEIFPVHRLDRDVGGVMVYAKNAGAAAALSAMVQSGEFKKEYLAVVHGAPAEPRGTMTDLLYHDARRNKSFVVKRERRGVRQAVLDYETLQSVNTDDGALALVQIALHTGRTHQIRVQFASRGLPLVGDRRYGAHDAARHIALWSHRITFLHPKSGERLVFTLPAPNEEPWEKFQFA